MCGISSILLLVVYYYVQKRKKRNAHAWTNATDLSQWQPDIPEQVLPHSPKTTGCVHLQPLLCIESVEISRLQQDRPL